MSFIDDAPRPPEEVEAAYLALFENLTYPNGPSGEVIVAHQFRMQLAWFLAAQGFQQVGKPVFKKVATPTALFPDGVEWVPGWLTEDEIRARLASDEKPAVPDEIWRPVNTIERREA